MAETEGGTKGGKGLKRRIGPLSLGGWLGSLGGAAVLFILFKRYEADKAGAAAAGGGTGAGILTAGGTVPGSTSQLPNAGGAPFSTYAGWLTAAIAQITSSSGLDAGQALNGITDWLSGQCVDQTQYTAIAQTIGMESIGLPPGFGSNIPQLSVCGNTGGNNPPPPPPPPPSAPPSPPPPPPAATEPIFGGLSAALSAAMTGNGETVAAHAWDPVLNEFIVLTNKGGIYNVNPSGAPSGGTFYGSYLGLPAADRMGGPRTFNSLHINSDGTYTIVDTAGESYTFNPGTASLEGV